MEEKKRDVINKALELSKEEAKEYFAKMNKTGELSDEELDNVAGGGWRKNGRGSSPQA